MRESTRADAVVLIVVNGTRGSGFSVQAKSDIDTVAFHAALVEAVHEMGKDLGVVKD